MDLNKPIWPCVDLLPDCLVFWPVAQEAQFVFGCILLHLILQFPLGGSDCVGVNIVGESNVRTYSGYSGFGVWQTWAQFTALPLAKQCP